MLLQGTIAAALAVTGVSATPAHATVFVIGGLSNFDVPNNTGKDEYEFEIELPSIDSSKISSLWQNTSAYRVGGVSRGHDYAGIWFNAPSSDNVAGHNSTYVDYKNPITAPNRTPAGFIEHFGIHFTNPYLNPAALYTWKDKNGIASDVQMPSVGATTATNLAGGVTVTPVVTNTSNTAQIVRFRTGLTTTHPTGVTLGDLVETDPEIQAVEAEPEPGDNGLGGVRLEPGQVLGIDGEAHDPTDPIIVNPAAWLRSHPSDPLLPFAVDLNNPGDAVLTVLDVFQAGATGNTPGTLIATFMSAVNTAQAVTDVAEPGSLLLLTGALMAQLARGRRRRHDQR